jgi:hypothetical protein
LANLPTGKQVNWKSGKNHQKAHGPGPMAFARKGKCKMNVHFPFISGLQGRPMVSSEEIYRGKRNRENIRNFSQFSGGINSDN